MVSPAGGGWAWIDRRRELSKETLSLESLRHRAARGGGDGVVQGACAFRAIDNLWLSVGQVSALIICCTHQPVLIAVQHAGGVTEAKLTSGFLCRAR